MAFSGLYPTEEHYEATGATTWTHSHTTNTPGVYSEAGVLVFIVHQDALASPTVTHGGVSVPFVARAVDSAGEPGIVDAYFLGNSIPAGTNNIVATFSTTSGEGSMFVLPVAAQDNTSVSAFDTAAGDATLTIMTIPTQPVDCFLIGCWYTGEFTTANVTFDTYTSTAIERDYGSQLGVVRRYDTYVTGGNLSMTNNTLDDTAGVAVAIREGGSFTVAKISGADGIGISKINGVAIANITKISGYAP